MSNVSNAADYPGRTPRDRVLTEREIADRKRLDEAVKRTPNTRFAIDRPGGKVRVIRYDDPVKYMTGILFKN